jgi:hypothetical protein
MLVKTREPFIIKAMTELNPIDEAVLQLLERSRKAGEQETADRARAVHELSRQDDMTLTVGGLLVQECVKLQSAFVGREKFYLDDANWFQKRRLRQSGQLGFPASIKQNGKELVPTRVQEVVLRHANIHGPRSFSVSGLLPSSAEDAAGIPIVQDWTVSTNSLRFMDVALRTINTDRQEIIETTPVYAIGALYGEAHVSEYDTLVEEEEDYFLPLGIVMAANQAVRATVPARVARKW